MTHHRHHSRRRQPKPRFRRLTPAGARPGTIHVHPEAPRPTIRVIRFGPQSIDDQDHVTFDELPNLLDQYPVTWIDVTGLGDAEIIGDIGELFGFHRLALEDVVHVHQRPKVEDFDDYLFIVARMPATTIPFAIEQLSMFVGKNYVVTWQESPGDCFGMVRERLQSPGRPIRNTNADYLAYALLDAIVDAYFPVLEEYGQRIDLLDDLVSRSSDADCMNQIHTVRADVRGLLRAAWPHRELVRRLSESQNELISEDTRTHLRDIYDHTLQILDLLESYRESCADLREFYMSAVSNRMNEVMKLLTIIATIFIPLSFIAGVYGMNFDPQASPWSMPELRSYWGYPATLAVMVVGGLGMLTYFWRKGWLGGSRDPREDAPR